MRGTCTYKIRLSTLCMLLIGIEFDMIRCLILVLVCVCVSCFLFVVCAFFLFGLLCCCSNRHTEKKVAINWSRQIKPWVSSFANVCIRSNSTFRPCIVGNVFWLHTIRACNINTHFFAMYASLNIVKFVLLLCAQEHTITCACAFAVLLIYSTLVLMVWH